jgi:hypothetical protein
VHCSKDHIFVTIGETGLRLSTITLQRHQVQATIERKETTKLRRKNRDEERK